MVTVTVTVTVMVTDNLFKHKLQKSLGVIMYICCVSQMYYYVMCVCVCLTICDVCVNVYYYVHIYTHTHTYLVNHESSVNLKGIHKYILQVTISDSLTSASLYAHSSDNI
jgi:hypothetical protein